MAQKDLGGKVLLSINEVFADVANVLLFKGERLIEEKDLRSADKHSQYHTDGKYHEQIRDVAKYWKKHGICLAMLGIENEAAPNRLMPLRVLSYDGGAYRTQLPKRKGRKKDKKEKTSKHIYPVITLVLNFSTKQKWNTAKSLFEAVDIPEMLRPYVNDYRINVVDVAFLDRKIIDSFKSEFWFVADYFWQIRNNHDYDPGKKRVKYIREILQMMSAITGDKRFEKAYNENVREGGEDRMCEYLDKIVGEGKREGRLEGRREGKLEGKLEGRREEKTESALRMLKKGIYSKEEISECLDIPVKDIEKIRSGMLCTV